MNQDNTPTVTMEEIQENLKALQKQEQRLNNRLTKLAGLLQDYAGLDEGVAEEYAEDRQVLVDEINMTLDAIKGCSLHQAQLGQLMREQSQAG